MKTQNESATSEALVDFFLQVAQRNHDKLNSLIEHNENWLQQKQWCFTLIQLHNYLQQTYPDFSHLNYPQFRALIYNCPINQRLKSYGTQISIVDNQNKADKSTYALIWQEDPNYGS